jgi:hypothetical protein
LADKPENAETIARQGWGMAQRVGMRIAGMPLEEREAALAIAENSLREAAKEMGIAGDQMNGFIELQMKAIRQIITDIDVSGSPQGGSA